MRFLHAAGERLRGRRVPARSPVQSGAPSMPVSGNGDASPAHYGGTAAVAMPPPSSSSDPDELLPGALAALPGQRCCWSSCCAKPCRAVGSKRTLRRALGNPRLVATITFAVLSFVLVSRLMIGLFFPGPQLSHRERDAQDGFIVQHNPGSFAAHHTKWKAVMVALNLYNNEELLPDFTTRVETLIDQVLVPTVRGDRTKIFVSVMSNGNKDSTPQLVDGILTDALKRTGVLMEVRSNASCCAAWGRPIADGGLGDETEHLDHPGFWKRPKNMSRIEWMACVRNAVMRPLYTERGVHGVFPSLPRDASADDVAVLFFNDIFFRTPDIADLLATNGGDVDLACGLDYYYSFYDTWVTRDIDGSRFDPMPPFAQHPTTQRAIATHSEAPIKCCWNGVALIRAAVFTDQLVESHNMNGGAANGVSGKDGRLRFRANATADGCYSSECQHLCADMSRRGRNKIYLNPRVRVTYESYFHKLQHETWWFSPDLFYKLVSWARVSTWPAFYRAPSQDRLTEGGLQCVTLEETFTVSESAVGSGARLCLVVGVALLVAYRYKSRFRTTLAE